MWQRLNITDWTKAAKRKDVVSLASYPKFFKGVFIMATFKILATKTIYVYDTIEADSIDEAYEMLDNGDYEIDFRNGDADYDVIIEPMEGK
jgi:hypothetical protein